MAARNAGRRPSELLEIPCPTAALDFDIASTVRINAYDLERDETRDKNLAVYIATQVNKILGGSADNTDDDTELV